MLDFSLVTFIRYAMEKGTSCTMRYRKADPKKLSKSVVAELGEDEVLISLEEKHAAPKSHWCTPPFYFYKAEDVRKIRTAIAEGCGTDGRAASWRGCAGTLHCTAWRCPEAGMTLAIWKVIGKCRRHTRASPQERAAERMTDMAMKWEDI